MTWEFNKDVAKSFKLHATQHIPNYNQVIDHCVAICKKQNKSIKIIDVGCAIGETLARLHTEGFDNIHGVDNSQAMLDECPTGIATLTCADTLPPGTYDIILMNWTLHFIKEKTKYLQDIYNNLNPNGILVISEKISLDTIAIEFYHDYKRNSGVSDAEILKKETSVKDIMHINSIEWYQDVFKKIGFSKVHIINAHWCFATFVCEK
jgi:tRNA (cmo5U34)-methyltransferase